MKNFVLIVQEGTDRDFDAMLLLNCDDKIKHRKEAGSLLLSYEDANALLNSRLVKHELVDCHCDMPYICELRYKLY